MSIESVMPSNHLILCRPLLLPPSIFPSIRVFSNEANLHITWPEYWSFSISPSSEYSGLISFRIDWFDLLQVQGTLKSLLQHHCSKASILQCSAFFKYAYLFLIWGSNNALLCYESSVRWFLPKLVSLCPVGRQVIKMASRSINTKLYVTKASIWMGVELKYL